MADATAVRLFEGVYARVDKQVRGVVAAELTHYQPNPRVVDVAFVLGTNGTPLLVDDLVFLRLGLNGLATVLSWSLAGTVAGVATSSSCAVDVLVGATLAAAATICGGNEPELTADIELNDQPPTSWTVAIPDPSWIVASVVSADGTVEVVGLTLRLKVDPRV